jgi:hypothetical protein
MIIQTWLIWAVLSAVFAAMMSIFAKLGLQRIDADAAQFLRTAIVLVITGLLVTASGKWNEVPHWSARTWAHCDRLGNYRIAGNCQWQVERSATLERKDLDPADAFGFVNGRLVALLFSSPRYWCGDARRGR